mmetsp:Transcript_35251/g.113557  ORF Transcript_35251/g.113557 Transcript_35251/m.113557 type:complete len:257 (+) Transcript_35251:199-969(+)
MRGSSRAPVGSRSIVLPPALRMMVSSSSGRGVVCLVTTNVWPARQPAHATRAARAAEASQCTPLLCCSPCSACGSSGSNAPASADASSQLGVTSSHADTPAHSFTVRRGLGSTTSAAPGTRSSADSTTVPPSVSTTFLYRARRSGSLMPEKPTRPQNGAVEPLTGGGAEGAAVGAGAACEAERRLDAPSRRGGREPWLPSPWLTPPRAAWGGGDPSLGEGTYRSCPRFLRRGPPAASAVTTPAATASSAGARAGAF